MSITVGSLYFDVEVRAAEGRWGHLSVFPEARRPAMAVLLGLMPTFDAFARAFIGFGISGEELGRVNCVGNRAGMMHVWKRTDEGCTTFAVFADNVQLAFDEYDDYVVGQPGSVTESDLEARREMSFLGQAGVVGLIGMQEVDAVGGGTTVAVPGDGRGDGYCYMTFVAAGWTDVAATALGPYPTVASLLSAPGVWFKTYGDLHGLVFEAVEPGRWHARRRVSAGFSAAQLLARLAKIRQCLGCLGSGSLAERLCVDHEPGETGVVKALSGATRAPVSALPLEVDRVGGKPEGVGNPVDEAGESRDAVWKLLVDVGIHGRNLVLFAGEDARGPVQFGSGQLQVQRTGPKSAEVIVTPRGAGVVMVPAGLLFVRGGLEWELSVPMLLVLNSSIRFQLVGDTPSALQYMALDARRWHQLVGAGLFEGVSDAYRLAYIHGVEWVIRSVCTAVKEDDRQEALTQALDTAGHDQSEVTFSVSLDNGGLIDASVDSVVECRTGTAVVAGCRLRPGLKLVVNSTAAWLGAFPVLGVGPQGFSYEQTVVADAYIFDGGGPSGDESTVSGSEYMRWSMCSRREYRAWVRRERVATC